MGWNLFKGIDKALEDTFLDWDLGWEPTDWEEKIEDIEKPEAPKAIDSDGDGLPDQIVDANTGEVLQDFTAINDMIKKAQNTEFPTFEQWQQENPGYQLTTPMESPSFQNLQTLTEDLRQGPSDTDIAASREYADEQLAAMLGVDVSELDALRSRLTEAVEGGPNAMQGFTPEQRAQRERAQQVQIQEMERRASRMIENIQANTGSATRAYMAADQALRNIQSAEIQAEVAMAEEEYRRQVAQSEAKEQMWNRLRETDQMSQSQYLQLLQQSKAQAFQGYATQINAMFQQNDQYLRQYNQELQRVQAHVNNIYQAVNAEMGVQSALAESIKDQYDIQLSEYQMELDDVLTEYQFEQDERAASRERWAVVFDGLTLLATIGAS